MAKLVNNSREGLTIFLKLANRSKFFFDFSFLFFPIHWQIIVSNKFWKTEHGWLLGIRNRGHRIEGVDEFSGIWVFALWADVFTWCKICTNACHLSINIFKFFQSVNSPNFKTNSRIESTKNKLVEKQILLRTRCWLSGQRTHLLLWWSKFTSCWSQPTVILKNIASKNVNK